MTPEELQAALTTARLRVNDWHACASADELARWRADQASLIIAAKASVCPEVEALSAKLQEAEQEIAAAMVILAPNMPSSGLVDACKQVKQVAISEADNSEKFEAKPQDVRAERDYLRDVVAKQANRITEIQSVSRGEVVKACPRCGANFNQIERSPAAMAGLAWWCKYCGHDYTEPALWQRVTPSCR